MDVNYVRTELANQPRKVNGRARARLESTKHRHIAPRAYVFVGTADSKVDVVRGSLMRDHAEEVPIGTPSVCQTIAEMENAHDSG